MKSSKYDPRCNPSYIIRKIAINKIENFFSVIDNFTYLEKYLRMCNFCNSKPPEVIVVKDDFSIVFESITLPMNFDVSLEYIGYEKGKLLLPHSICIECASMYDRISFIHIPFKTMGSIILRNGLMAKIVIHQ